MNVNVQMFAVAAELTGESTVVIQLDEGATVTDLRWRLAELYPELASMLGNFRFAVDEQYAGDDTVLRENAEVACIPPVSGG